MAILDAVPGLEVQVLVDNIALKEYKEPLSDDDDGQIDPANTQIFYIEAKKDAVFQVSVNIDPNFTPRLRDIVIRCYIDGNATRGHIIWRNDKIPASHVFSAMITFDGGKDYEQELIFQELKISK